MSFVLPTLPRIVSGVKKTSPPCRPRGMRRYSAAHSGKSPAATGDGSLIDNSEEQVQRGRHKGKDADNSYSTVACWWMWWKVGA